MLRRGRVRTSRAFSRDRHDPYKTVTGVLQYPDHPRTVYTATRIPTRPHTVVFNQEPPLGESFAPIVCAAVKKRLPGGGRIKKNTIRHYRKSRRSVVVRERDGEKNDRRTGVSTRGCFECTAGGQRERY